MPALQRSPRYPSMPIEGALKYLQILFTAIHHSKFLLEDAASAWKYAPSSGSVRLALGALRQYGLLAGKPGEPSKISELGLSLVINDRSSTEFFKSVEEAALVPSLFRKVHDEYGDLADSALKSRLMLDHKFSEQGALKFISSYRSTLQFVEMHRPTRSDIVDRDREDLLGESIDDEQSSSEELSLVRPALTETSKQAAPPAAQTSDQVNVIPLQLIGGKFMVTIHLPAIMSASAWNQMMTMLTALRPGYIQIDETEGATKRED